MHEETGIFKLISAIVYLRNIFKEDSYTTCMMVYDQNKKAIMMKLLVLNEETNILIGWIRRIEENCNKIVRIVLGLWLNNKLLEKYVIDMSYDYDYKKICEKLQKWPEINGKIKIAMQIYSYEKLNLGDFENKNEFWELKNFLMYKFRNLWIYHVNDDLEDKEYIVDKDFIEEEKNDSNKDEAAKSIRCVCGINNEEKHMIKCIECYKWLHANCLGFFSKDDRRIPSGFKCCFCLKKFSPGIQNLAIYRRTLAVLYNENIRSKVFLMRRLGICSDTYKTLIDLMKIDKYASFQKGKGYIGLTNEETEKKLMKMFPGIDMECVTSIKNIQFYCL